MIDKPATTYRQQMWLLKSRGCVISDEKACMRLLKNISYYRLTAYLLPLRDDEGNFRKGTTFEQIVGLYEFDQKLRSWLFPIIEEIEIALRSRVSYLLSHKYGPLGYLECQTYITEFVYKKGEPPKKRNHEKFIEDIFKIMYDNRKNPIVEHHVLWYDGKLPIWAIVELFSFGKLSRLYADMLLEDRKIIAKSFNTTEYYLVRWLICLSDLRNICAHYGRLYYAKFPGKPSFPDRVHYDANDASGWLLFPQVLATYLALPDKDKWKNSYFLELEALINTYYDEKQIISLDHIGFPTDWKRLLLSEYPLPKNHSSNRSPFEILCEF